MSTGHKPSGLSSNRSPLDRKKKEHQTSGNPSLASELLSEWTTESRYDAQMPPQRGQMPPQRSQMPPQRSQMPPQRGQMPPQRGQIPPQRGQMPPQRGQMPPQRGQMPPQRGQMPPQQNPKRRKQADPTGTYRPIPASFAPSVDHQRASGTRSSRDGGYSREIIQTSHSLQNSNAGLGTNQNPFSPSQQNRVAAPSLGSLDNMTAFHSGQSEPLEVLRDAWKSFGQAIKKYALYGHQREGKENFFIHPFQTFQAYLQLFGSLTVSIQPFDFTFNNESVFRDESQENSLTYKLHRAGFRTLTLEPSLHFEEFTKFGKILMKTPLELEVEDIASLVWREDFQTITYLQLQSIEMLEEQDGDAEELGQFVSLIKSQMLSNDPSQGVNLRGLAVMDLQAEQTLANAETHRHFGVTPERFSMQEDAPMLHAILEHEEQHAAGRGIELYVYLLRHIEDPEAFSEFEPHVETLCYALLEDRDYQYLAVFLDALLWQLESPHIPFPHERKEFLKRIFALLTAPPQMDSLHGDLTDVSDLEQEQKQDLRIYLQILGTKVYKEIITSIPKANGPTRRFLMETLFTSQHSIGLFQQLLTEYQKQEKLLYELLEIAPFVGIQIEFETINELLEHSSQRVQSKAFLLLLEQYPEDAPFLAEQLLQKAGAEFRLFLVGSLCQASDLGIILTLSYMQTENAQKLPHSELEKLFVVIGQSQTDAVIQFFASLLEQKSRMLKPQIDRQKRLALLGLKATNHYTARQKLLNALQNKQLHGKKLMQEIQRTLTFMQNSL